MSSLTELTGHQLAIEDALTAGGYFHELAAFRAAWRTVDAAQIPAVLDDFAFLAARAQFAPRRFVIPAGEPVALEAVDIQAARAAAQLALLSSATLASCRDSHQRARFVHRAAANRRAHRARIDQEGEQR